MHSVLSYLISSPFFHKISVETLQVTLPNRASPSLKLLCLQTSAAPTYILHSPTYWKVPCPKHATLFLSPPFEAASSPPLQASSFFSQPLNYRLPVHNPFTYITLHIFSHVLFYKYFVLKHSTGTFSHQLTTLVTLFNSFWIFSM